MGIFVWLLIVVFITIIFIKYWDERDFGLAVLSGMLISVALMVVLAFGSIFQPKVVTNEVVSDVKIKSIKPTQNIHGSFFLGSGNIDTVDYLFVLYVQGNGSYKKWKSPAEKTNIFESDEVPHLKTTQIKSRGKYTKKLWYPLAGGENDSCPCDEWKYDLYVPKGTVIENYSVM